MLRKITLTALIITLCAFYAPAQNAPVSLIMQSAAAKEAKENIEMEHTAPGIYIFKMNTEKMGCKIKPYVADKLTATSDVFKNSEKYDLVINGGFFDIVTGNAVSYVTIDGNVVETPFSNQKLIENAGKTNRLEAILNRAEFRILEDKKGNLIFDMDHHFVPVQEGLTLKHSLQGGPFVYPSMNLEKESFLKVENNKVKFQAADVLKRRERTILALKNEMLYIVLFTNQNKVTMNEVRDFCKKMKFDKAMALDGGASTSANFKDLEIYSSFTSQRRVKSFLTVEK